MVCKQVGQFRTAETFPKSIRRPGEGGGGDSVIQEEEFLMLKQAFLQFGNSPTGEAKHNGHGDNEI